MVKHSASLAPLVLAVALLSACGSDSAEPSTSTSPPTPSATVEPPLVTPAPSPSPSLTTSPTPEPSWTPNADITFQSYFDVRIGDNFQVASERSGVEIAGQPDCPYLAVVSESDDFSTVAFTDASGTSDQISFFYSMLMNYDTPSPLPKTAENVGLGSTIEQVQSAYPSATTSQTSDLGAGDITTITVDDPDTSSQYVFGVMDGSAVVDLFQWGPNSGTQWSHLCGGL